MKIKLDLRKLERAATEAFQETCEQLHEEILEAMSDRLEGFPDDLIDTGNLRDAQQPPQFTRPIEAVFENTAEYAIFVALGYQLRNGEEQDGRNWMAIALDGMNFQETFELLLRSKL